MDKPSIDDKILTLVRKSQKRDAAAFGDLIEATQSRLFRFLIYMSGNTELAQDLTQDTFVKLWDNLPKLKEPEKFWSWLFKMAKNLFIDHVRASKNNMHYTPIEEADRFLEDLSTEKREVTLEIQSVLARMKPEERTLILLIYFEEYTCAEAAEIMGLSENAVWTRLHRVRQEFEDKYMKAQKIKNL